MYNFSFMLKSYLDDFNYAKRLIHSFNRYNIENLSMHILVPEGEYDLFKDSFQSKNIDVLNEDEMDFDFVNDDSICGIRPGYINQEIVKLQFWEAGFSENYFCIDSDAEFIRDFRMSDFMFDDSTPYSVLVEDKELHVDPQYYSEFWIGRDAWLKAIKEEIGITDRKTITCHGGTVLNKFVLQDFKNKFLSIKKWAYKDCLNIGPYEFSWYNFWLQVCEVIKIYPCEPHFKIFHNRAQHLDWVKKGITIEDIARAYVGVIVNSNYSRGYGLVGYNDVHAYRLQRRIKNRLEKLIRRV